MLLHSMCQPILLELYGIFTILLFVGTRRHPGLRYLPLPTTPIQASPIALESYLGADEDNQKSYEPETKYHPIQLHAGPPSSAFCHSP